MTKSRGIGTIIKDVTAAWKIKGYSTCAACKNLAKELDAVSYHTVEENWSVWINKLNESIKSWRNERSIPIPHPPQYLVDQLLRYAVDQHKAEAELQKS